jgi:lipopolysaccharide export system permease protein
MRILDKYFLKEFCRPLFYCVGAFLLCWFVYDLMDNFGDFFDSRDFMGMLKYYAFLLPAWLVQIMPITLLLALLYTLADMSKSGELIAMRAMGMDLYRLMIPIFIIAVIVTALMLMLNLTWAPRARLLANNQRLSLRKEVAVTKQKRFNIFYKSLQADRSWYIEEFHFGTGKAFNIDLVDSDDEGHDVKKYVAARGEFRNGHWKLYDVLLYDMTKGDNEAGRVDTVAEIDLPDCKDSPDKFLMTMQKPVRMSSRELTVSLKLDKNMPRQRRSQYLMELYSRIAFPFSNLVVILIGIPFGIMPHRRSSFLAITNALFIFFGYMLVSQFFLILGNNGQLPAIIASWLPNVAFGALGIYLIRSVR